MADLLCKSAIFKILINNYFLQSSPSHFGAGSKVSCLTCDLSSTSCFLPLNKIAPGLLLNSTGFTPALKLTFIQDSFF